MHNNTYPRFIDPKPLGKDLYEGKSQERISKSISENIKSNISSSKIIGLEGEWGSGKSNVICLIKHELKDTHYVYVYDAWGHQEDFHRRSFLEGLTHELIENELLPNTTSLETLDGNIKSVTWKEKLKYLLSRKKETDTTTIPKLSFGIQASILLIIITPIMEKFGKLFSCPYITAAITFSPLLIAILTLIFLACKRKVNINDLFAVYNKKQITNTINEIVTEIEPSVNEFNKWICDISNDLINYKLVIVYDNMDRLPPEKVKEIWSSIHTFFAEGSYENIWTLITFDRSHLQQAFRRNDNGNEEENEITNQFINKTFSLIYRIAPPVLTDWKKLLKLKFIEAFGETENNEYNMLLSIFDRLNYKFTPRDIVVFINELVSLKGVWRDDIPLRYMALFTLSKDDILKNPKEQIISNSYLKGATTLFQHDTDLQKYISALVYNVPVEKASQVLLMRDLELILRNDSQQSINALATHNDFLDIIEDVIHNSELNLEATIQTFAELDRNLLIAESPEERITALWDDLLTETIKYTILEQTITNNHKYLLLYSSPPKRLDLVKHIIQDIYKVNNFSGSKYVDSIISLEKFISENELNIDIDGFIKEKEVEPEIFLDYLSRAQSEYKKYRIRTDSSIFNKYLISKVPNELPETNILNYLISDEEYDFKELRNRIENAIKNNEVTHDNFYKVIKTYESILIDKPFEVILSSQQLFSILTQIKTPEQNGYYDLVAMRLSYGNTYNLHTAKLGKDNTSDILNETKEIYVNNIARRIEFYSEYGKLLLLVKDWQVPLAVEVIRDLTINNYGISRMSIEDILPYFEKLKTILKLEARDLIKRFNSWNKFAEKDITKDNLQQIIPDVSFYEYSFTIESELTSHINKIAIEFVKSVESNQYISEWNNDNSYIYSLLYKLMQHSLVSDLPENAFLASKEVFKDIASSKQPIPESTSSWNYILQQARKTEVTATIHSIREDFARSKSINPSLFMFFAELFEEYGGLKEEPSISNKKDFANFTRNILDEVINDDNCFNYILNKKELYSKIIIHADAHAADFKDKIKQKLAVNPNIDNLISFAETIGVQIENTLEKEIKTE